MLPMKNPETGAEYTYSTSSVGGVRACKKLVGNFVKQIKAAPETTAGCLPVVELGVQSYQHPDRKRGTIFNPVLTGIDWVRASEIAATSRHCRNRRRGRTTQFRTSKTRTRKVLGQPRHRFRLHGAISKNRRRKPRLKSRPSGGRTFSTPAERNDESGHTERIVAVGDSLALCQFRKKQRDEEDSMTILKPDVHKMTDDQKLAELQEFLRFLFLEANLPDDDDEEDEPDEQLVEMMAELLADNEKEERKK
jgi:hypothetical protein